MKTRILHLLPVGQVMQALQPKRDQELLGGDEGIGRSSPGRPWPGPDYVARMQPPDQIATNLLAEDILEPVARDRLMVGDGSQNGDVDFAQIE